MTKIWNKKYLKCIGCGETKKPHKGHGYCTGCYNKSEYGKRNKAKWRASGKGKYWYHDYDQKLKIKAIKHYSNGKNCCAICGYDDIRALTIDHIENNGAEHRKTFNTTINAWLRTHKYPKGFQVLCCNCNWIKEVERRRNKADYTLGRRNETT